jgi:hypothetical protein
MKTSIILTLALVLVALASFSFIHGQQDVNARPATEIKSSPSFRSEPAGGFGSEDRL